MLFAIVTYFNQGDYMPSFIPIKRHIVYDMLDALLGIYVVTKLFMRFFDRQLGALSVVGAKWSMEYYVVHLFIYKIIFSYGISIRYTGTGGMCYYLYVCLIFILVFSLSSLAIKGWSLLRNKNLF